MKQNINNKICNKKNKKNGKNGDIKTSLKLNIPGLIKGKNRNSLTYHTSMQHSNFYDVKYRKFLKKLKEIKSFSLPWEHKSDNNVECISIDNNKTNEIIEENKLNIDIKNMATYILPTKSEKLVRENILQDIKNKILSLYNNAEIILFGSLFNNITSFRGDLDIVVRFPSMEMFDNLPNSKGSVESSTKETNEKYLIYDTDSENSIELDSNDSNNIKLNIQSSSQNTALNVDDHIENSKTNFGKVTKRKGMIRQLQRLRQLRKHIRKQNNCPVINNNDSLDFNLNFQYISEIRYAKHPIINLIHPDTKIEIDIQIQDSHSSTDNDINKTTHLIRYLSKIYVYFDSIALVLKEFFYQNNINKVSNGGIGSFRMYIMLGKILDIADNEANNTINAWSLLQFFFEYYSQAKFLSRDSTISYSSHINQLEWSINFIPCYRLKYIRDLFSKAYKAMEIYNNKKDNSVASNKINFEKKTSIADIIILKKLEHDRKISNDLATLFVQKLLS